LGENNNNIYNNNTPFIITHFFIFVNKKDHYYRCGLFRICTRYTLCGHEGEPH